MIREIKIVEAVNPIIANQINALMKEGWVIEEEGGMVKTKRGALNDVRTDTYYIVLYKSSF